MAKIKICGLSRRADIDYVNEALPDYVGFIFTRSRRQVTAEGAAHLRQFLDDRITPVGVFNFEPVEDIVRLYRHGIIRMAQLHGSVPASYIAELKAACPITVIRVLPIDDAVGLPLSLPTDADYLLFDYKRPGSSQSFDWNILKGIQKPYFLAGGINAQNIETALSYKPYCVDVSSGAETDGIKNGAKIRSLVELVRALP
jgi:phosphoribosylanthranilate isomerase